MRTNITDLHLALPPSRGGSGDAGPPVTGGFASRSIGEQGTVTVRSRTAIASGRLQSSGELAAGGPWWATQLRDQVHLPAGNEVLVPSIPLELRFIIVWTAFCEVAFPEPPPAGVEFGWSVRRAIASGVELASGAFVQNFVCIVEAEEVSVSRAGGTVPVALVVPLAGLYWITLQCGAERRAVPLLVRLADR